MNGIYAEENSSDVSWAGLGLLAAGCAPKVSDYAQKSGRRVVVNPAGRLGVGRGVGRQYVRWPIPRSRSSCRANKTFVSCRSRTSS